MNNSTNGTGLISEGDKDETVCSWIISRVQGNTETIFTWHFFIAVLNIVFAITASCGNILVLLALSKEYTLSAPSRVLFRSLATSDLCAGIISQPLYAISILLIGNGHLKLCRLMRYLTFVSSTTLCGVSLLTLTAISLDRLLVLTLKSSYYRIVTRSLVIRVVVLFWTCSLVTGIAYLLSRRILFIVICLVILLSIVISAYSYSNIFFLLRRRQRVTIRDSHTRLNGFQLRRALRFKSTVYSALWVHLTLVICYLPFSVLGAVAFRIGTPLPIFIAGTCTATLIYLNSTINPFLYCWKIKEVRQAVKQILRKCL